MTAPKYRKGFHFRPYPVRLSCGHLVTFTAAPPPVGTGVWCTACESARRCQFHYFGRETQCGATSRLVLGGVLVTLRCSRVRHSCDGEHYDGPLDVWFTGPGLRLRSGREGLAGNRA